MLPFPYILHLTLLLVCWPTRSVGFSLQVYGVMVLLATSSISLDTAFDQLADVIEESLDMAALEAIIGL